VAKPADTSPQIYLTEPSDMLSLPMTRPARPAYRSQRALTKCLTRKDARRGTSLGPTQVHFALRMWQKMQPTAPQEGDPLAYTSNFQRKINSRSSENRTRLPSDSTRVPAFAAQ